MCLRPITGTRMGRSARLWSTTVAVLPPHPTRRPPVPTRAALGRRLLLHRRLSRRLPLKTRCFLARGWRHWGRCSSGARHLLSLCSFQSSRASTPPPNASSSLGIWRLSRRLVPCRCRPMLRTARGRSPRWKGWGVAPQPRQLARPCRAVVHPEGRLWPHVCLIGVAHRRPRGLTMRPSLAWRQEWASGPCRWAWNTLHRTRLLACARR
jgi:hypothetical protein